MLKINTIFGQIVVNFNRSSFGKKELKVLVNNKETLIANVYGMSVIIAKGKKNVF